MKRKTLIIFIVFIEISIFLYLIFIGGFFTYKKIIQPSYLSVIVACKEMSIKELNSMGYKIGGVYYASSNSIKINYPTDDYHRKYNEEYDYSWSLRNEYYQTEKYHRIVKHERCHRQQKEENRIYFCDSTIGKYLNEFECYLVQYF